MRYFTRQSIFKWRVLEIMSFVLLFIILIMVKLYSFIYDYNKINFEFGEGLYIFYCYEKIIFIICIILLCCSQLFRENSMVNTFTYFQNYTVIIERHSFAYLCLLQPSIFLFFSFFNVVYSINTINLLIMTTGVSIFLSLIAILYCVLFELPCRAIFRRVICLSEEGKKTDAQSNYSEIN